MGDHRLIFELDRESFCLKSISQSCPARSASCTGTTCILYRYRYTAARRAMMAEQWAMGADDRHFQRAQRAPATRVQCCRDQIRSAARATKPALSHSRSSGRRSVSLLRLLRKPEEPHKWLTDFLPVLLLCDSAGIVARAAARNASLQHCGRVVGARCPL